ncbi:TIGR03621 family F420-dependent LLM class oxidoreductase [Nocardia terpenica]|uniref:F420-dependent oxidoreductase n=1 Tax=Nocardia terpenica TaxID=455432 RepID=A0A291RPJ1_9NOCA|nr:TIGR03621 family F420-dependent LLM class oxidoreductase [Nocardia terpenica]ATL69124.1 F420-dependent oxidoreductase [Nocardia terpenica]
MAVREFRFGASGMAPGSRAEWQAAARQVEAWGYDTLLVPDHLGMVAPFPALMAAADVTERIRLGTMVVNTGLWRPAMLARDAAGVDQLSDGRLELGLGAGNDAFRAEFEKAGLPYHGARQRIEFMEQTVTELRGLFADPEHYPRPAQRNIPILIAGQGDRLLAAATRHADIVGLSGVRPGESPTEKGTLAERIAYIEKAAGDRLPQIEINMMIIVVAVTGSGTPDFTLARFFYPDLSDDELLTVPGILHGTVDQMADTLRHYRETYGVTYFTVVPPAVQAFAEVIARIR